MADSYNELLGLASHGVPDVEAWWQCQDNAADRIVIDSSANGYDGTFGTSNTTANESTTTPLGYYPRGFAMDGQNSDRFTTPDVWDFHYQTENAFYCWIKTSASGENYIAGTDLQTGWYLRSGTDTKLLVKIDDGTTDDEFGSGTTTINDNSWNFVGISWGDGALKGWVNGVDEINIPYTANKPLYDQLNLGKLRNSGSTNQYYTGVVTGAVLFNRTLTDAENLELYNGPELECTVAPVVTGTEEVGETLSCTTGTWALPSEFASGSNGTPSYSYQWTRSTSAAGAAEADISGATSATYVLAAADSGKFIRCRVRGTNTGGFDPSQDTDSNMSGAIGGVGPTATPKGVFGLPLHGPLTRAVY